MASIDFLIILLFLAYAVFNGMKSRKIASKNLQEYFLAGRSLSGWQAGTSMAATQFAADTPLLVTGLIATGGIFALWQLWIYAIAFMLLGFVLAGPWRRSNVLTDAELTEIRYGGAAALILRLVKALYFGTVFNCIVLAWVLFAAARIAEPFLPWNDWLPAGFFEHIVSLVEYIGVPITLALETDESLIWAKTANDLISITVLLCITAFYSTTGGLRSVVATDIAQFIVMMLATLVYAAVLLYTLGGFEGLLEKLSIIFSESNQFEITLTQLTSFTPWHAKDASLAIIMLFGMQWLIQINADGTGYLAQRTLACRSDKDACQAAIIFTFLQVFMRSLIWIAIGLSLLVIYPPVNADSMLQASREVTFVYGISDMLPVGVKGLMVAAMFAAFASTVDSHLNWGASYWTNDLFKRLLCEKILKKTPKQTTLVLVARISNILLVITAMFIATRLTSINQAWQTSLLFGAGLGPVLVMRWLWWRITAISELTAIISSLISAPLLMIYVENPAERLLAAAAISTAGALLAVFFGPGEKHSLLLAFYEKVRPVGFWKHIASLSQTSEFKGNKILFKKLLSAFCAAFTVFTWLISVGGFFLESPPPPWFPWSYTIWCAILFLCGSLCVPFWLKQANADN